MVKILTIQNESSITLAYLNNLENGNVHEIINGEYTLNFVALIEPLKTEHLYNKDNLIVYNNDYFRVVNFEELHSEDNMLTIEVTAEHISYDLIKDTKESFVYNDRAAIYVMNEALTDTNFTFLGTDVTATASIDLQRTEEKPLNVKSILYQIAIIWGGELEYFQRDIELKQQLGQNRGVDFRFGKNIQNIRRIVNFADDTISYDVEVVQGSELEELGYFELGDTIRVIDDALNIDIYTRIIEVERDIITGINSRVILGQPIGTILDNITGINKKIKETEEKISAADNKIDETAMNFFDAIENIELTPGPQGEPGPQGPSGPKGDTGTQGPKGENGQTSYFHVAYADTSTGGGFNQDPTGKEFIGTYVDFSSVDSTDPTKYSWALIKGSQGEKGDQGIPGQNGADGQTTYLHIAYADDASGNGFSQSPTGKTYMGTYTDFIPQDSSDKTKYIWVKIKGEQGPQGLQGLQGPQGNQGIQGPVGTDGLSSYTHIAYANNATGTSGFSTTDSVNKLYIGMYVDNLPNDSTDPSRYNWTLIKGADGAQGIPGPKGDNGQTSYLHIAYANNSTGTSGFSTTDSANKLYIGQYTDYTSADSTDPTKYSWTKIKGDTGATGATGPKGDQGIPGTPGADGITYYTWIKYADTPTSGMSDSPTNKKYMGIAVNKTTQTESTNYSDYTWSLTKGDQGVQGEPGTDGQTTYTWVKYADTPTSGISDNPTNKKYIGLAFNKNTATESTNYSDYTWSLMPQNIEVGGRNLIKEIPFEKEYLIGTNTLKTYPLTDTSKVIGQEVTLSFYGKSSTGSNKVYISIAVGSSTRTNITGNLTLPLEYEKFTYTFNSSSDENINNIMFVYGTQWHSSNEGTISIKEVKLEKGNIATDWTPAPEDIDQKIITTYYQTTTPVNAKPGDLWFNTTTKKLYRRGVAWDLIEDAGITEAVAAAQTAQTTADGKIVTYYGSTTPENPSNGDLWYKIENEQWYIKNMNMAISELDSVLIRDMFVTKKLYRFNISGDWQPITDSDIEDVRNKVDKVVDEHGMLIASKLSGTLQTAVDTVTGSKNGGVTYAEGVGIVLHNQPVQEESTEAMLLTANGLLISNSKNTDGTWRWRTAATGKSISADAITTGTLTAVNIDAVTITGSTLISESSTQRVTIDDGLIEIYDKNLDEVLLSAEDGHLIAKAYLQTGTEVGATFIDNTGIYFRNDTGYGSEIKGGASLSLSSDTSINIDAGLNISIDALNSISLSAITVSIDNLNVNKLEGRSCSWKGWNNLSSWDSVLTAGF